jgi:hypothetical protein
MRYTPGTTRLELRVRVFPQKAWLKPIVMLHTSHPTTSNESAALFLGLFTCLTGQTFSTSSQPVSTASQHRPLPRRSIQANLVVRRSPAFGHAFTNSPVRVRCDDGEPPHHRAVEPLEPFPQTCERHRLNILACDGIGLLPTFYGLQFVEGVCRDHAPPSGKYYADRGDRDRLGNDQRRVHPSG